MLGVPCEDNGIRSTRYLRLMDQREIDPKVVTHADISGFGRRGGVGGRLQALENQIRSFR